MNNKAYAETWLSIAAAHSVESGKKINEKEQKER